MKQGLVLIDLQNDYFKGGKFELYKPEAAAVQAAKILDYFRKQCLPIFHIQHINVKPNPVFFAPDTEGANIYKAVAPLQNEVRVVKHYPDSFLQTNLQQELEAQGVTELVVCGMMSHMCIDTTVRSAVAKGYGVTLIENACTARALEWEGKMLPAQNVHNVFMAALASGFAKVMKADEWLSNYKKAH